MRALTAVVALTFAAPASGYAYTIDISRPSFDLEVRNDGTAGGYEIRFVEFDLSQLLVLSPEESIGSVRLLLFNIFDPTPRTPGINLYGFVGDGVFGNPSTGDETLLASDIADGISQAVETFDVKDFVTDLVEAREQWAGFSLRADVLSPFGTGLVFYGGTNVPRYPAPVPTLRVEVLPEADGRLLVVLVIAMGSARVRSLRRRL